MRVTILGNLYTDDGSAAPARDMQNGGFRTWLLAMIADMVTLAASIVTGVMFVPSVRIVTGTGAQAMSGTDNLIKWQPAAPAAVTFTLPSVPATGETHEFKYALRTGTLFDLTVTPAAGHTIDGQASITIDAPNQNLRLTFDGVSEWIVR